MIETKIKRLFPSNSSVILYSNLQQASHIFSKFILCNLYILSRVTETTSVVYWTEFLATDPEVPGSIPGATRFSEK
jgi:hypothetical protein